MVIRRKHINQFQIVICKTTIINYFQGVTSKRTLVNFQRKFQRATTIISRMDKSSNVNWVRLIAKEYGEWKDRSKRLYSAFIYLTTPQGQIKWPIWPKALYVFSSRV